MKDYEAFAKVSKSLDETMEYGIDEARDLLMQLIHGHYSGRQLNLLTNEEKGQLAIMLVTKYNMSINMSAHVLGMSEHIVNQFLRAKDYGNQR